MMVSFGHPFIKLDQHDGILPFVIYNLISSFPNVNQPCIYYRGWRHGCRRFDAVARTYRHRN